MKCLICTNEKELQIVERPDLQIFIYCPVCEYTWQKSEQLLSLEQEKSRYLEHNNDTQDRRYLHYLKKTWEKLPDFLEKVIVVDYGCGPTQGLQSLLQNSGHEVISYDPVFFPDWPKIAEKRVDVIFCSEAIEHAFNPVDVFEKWEMLLRSSGWITLRTAFHQGPEFLKTWWYLEDPTHVGVFSERTWRWVAEKRGWKVRHLHSPYASFFVEKTV